MKITLHIPDDLAVRLGTPSELERELLENLALQAFKRGDLSRAEISRLLGFNAVETDAFLILHKAPAKPDDVARSKARQAVDNILARRKGVTLGSLSAKELINECRPQT